MIATVTLNLALDVTYHLARLSPDATHRVGGKGANVACILHTLGHEIVSAISDRRGSPLSAPRRVVARAPTCTATPAA